MHKRIKKLSFRAGGAALLAALALTVNYFGQTPEPPSTPTIQPTAQVTKQPTTQPILTPTSADGQMEVHFIDVGQGDSILIKDNSHAMLIDAGENNQGETVVNYLKKENVKELDYVIATHPHSDHIGGMDTVIQNIKIDQVILPKVAHNTKTYEDVLDAIQNKNITVKQPKVGDNYTLGKAHFIILSPSSTSYEEMNNYSVGIKITLGKISFVMAGDAEKLSEKEMTQTGIDLSADVLKLSHHGAANGINDDFYNAVNPKYAVISVGKNNDYNHPSSKVVKAMIKRGITIFRTDVQGSIVFQTDGTNLTENVTPYIITKDDLNKGN